MRPSEQPGTIEGMRAELARMRREIRDLQVQVRRPIPTPKPDPTPLPFHWHGALADHIDVRNGPGEFGADGRIHMIRYRRDDPTGAVTVQWRLGASLAATHTLPAGDSVHIERPDLPYHQQAIVAVLTAAAGEGMTAFVYFR